MVNELCNTHLMDCYAAFENIYIEFIMIEKIHE